MLITIAAISDTVDLGVGVPTWLALEHPSQLRFKIGDSEIGD